MSEVLAIQEKAKSLAMWVTQLQEQIAALEAERDQLLQKTQQLEAERDALRELVKQAHEYMCVTGEAPIHLAKQFQAIGGGDATR